MVIENKKVFINSFFHSQLNHCPLVWVCHSCRNNPNINSLHERYLSLIVSTEKSSQEEVLER